MREGRHSAARGAVIAAVWVAIGLWGCADDPPLEPEPVAQEPRVTAVTVLMLEPRSIIDAAILPADIQPRRRATLAAEVAGVVERMHVDAGDFVTAGQPLLEIETRTLGQLLAEAEAVHRQRQIQFDRATALLERRSITKAQFLDALTARDVALTRLESARLEMEKSVVKAPWAGQIASTHFEVGDFAVVGKPAIELVDASRVEVVATAPAAHVPFLKTGLKTEVSVDIYPGESFPGLLTRLGAELDASTRTLEVTIELGNPEGRLRPGLSARVRVPRRQLESALLVPLSAVVEVTDGEAVYVAVEGRAEQREVELGTVIGEASVVVESGLVAGDAVIIEGQRRISPGQRIEAAVPR